MRPRLLFLCHTLPYPPDGGPWIRTYHVLRQLAQAFDITALCFERAATAGRGVSWDVAVGRDGLGLFANVEVFEIPQRHSHLRWVWDHVRSTVLGRVYTTYVYRSGPFHQRVKELLQSQSFDLIHVDSLDLSDYLPACDGVPVVCVHHDVQSALLGRRAGVEKSVWRRTYLRYQAALMQQEERRWCERIALNVAVSHRDADVLKTLAPAARTAIVPNGVDVDEFRPASASSSGVAFAGGAIAFPNPDALDFFCSDILPHLRATGRNIPVRWIGRASAEQQTYYGERYGVELTGYVEDVKPLMRDAACHVVPLRAGGGTRLKILNSWAMGKPVVSTTTIGCEGLAAIDGVNMLIRDDPQGFAQAILAVLDDPDLGRRLGEGGRATVEEHYGWDGIGRNMVEAYLSVVSDAMGSRTRVPLPMVGARNAVHP